MIKTIAVIGDSNSSVNDWHISKKCWPTYLQERLPEDVKVHNWSIPGATLSQGSWMLGNVLRNISNYAPDMVIITLGINDIQVKTSVDFCKQFLYGLFETCVKNKPIILLGKVDASSQYFLAQREEAYLKQSTEIFDSFAEVFKAKLFNFLTPEDLNNASDGIHPNEDWHQAIAKKVAEITLPLLTTLSKETLETPTVETVAVSGDQGKETQEITDQRIAVVGDSNSSFNQWTITKECWPSLLQKELKNVKVDNWSIPGATLNQGYWMLENARRNISGYSPNTVIITMGLNSVVQKTLVQDCKTYLDLLFKTCVKNKPTIILGKTDALSKHNVKSLSKYYEKKKMLELKKQFPNGSKDAFEHESKIYGKEKGIEHLNQFKELFDLYAAEYQTKIFNFLSPSDLENANDHLHPRDPWPMEVAKRVNEIISSTIKGI